MFNIKLDLVTDLDLDLGPEMELDNTVTVCLKRYFSAPKLKAF